MAQRPRQLSDFQMWVTMKLKGLNVRLNGYVLRQCLWIITWGNGYTTTVADFIRLDLNFILQIVLWGLRG